jgi:WD repeat-containing protein 35
MKFTLPHVSIEPKLFFQSRPNLLYVNCNATRMISIDLHGTLQILEMNA